jgi:hypothetical protein
MACARWETAYITEWLLYHQAIGFDHVYLYCNDDDPTDLYGQVLPFCRGAAPFVTFHHYPFQGQQFYMMMDALRRYKDESQWVAFLDIDEFLVLPELDDVQAYLQRCPAHWDAIHFNWSFFGNNGHFERPSGSVLTTYTRREDRVHVGIKTITRSARIDLSRITRKTYIWHGWDGLLGPDFVAVNVLGDPIDLVKSDDEGVSYLKPGEIQSRIRKIGFVNHYAFKSARDFDLRIERGTLGEFSTQLAWKQVADSGNADAALRAFNAVEDTYLADFWRHFLRDCHARQSVSIPQLPNVALGKQADQSSMSEWSRGATTREDASGVVSGSITGDAQCHTGLENDPWWMVDLGSPHLIYEIRVFNRVNQPSFRERLGAFRLELAGADNVWASIYDHDGSRLVGGADGYPLILRLATPIVGVGLRLVALGHTYLHLDQVEVYGVPVADAGSGEGVGTGSAEPATVRDPPIVHVEGRGRTANQMIQFMAAYAIAVRVPGCRLSGVDLPEWGIHYPEVPREASTRETHVSPPKMQIGRDQLVADLISGRCNRVHLDSYAQHLDNFLAPEAYAGLFRTDLPDIPVFGPDHLVIQIRGEEVLRAAHPDYTLLPAEFYQEVVAQSGLIPVFMGQTDANSYTARLRALFPEALFLPSGGPIRDFETIRRADNILTCVSTFGWLAAWLSNAERIYLPMTGFLNPAQFPEIDLLPLDDPRYRFYLFPANYAVPEAEVPVMHASLRGNWRLMDAAMIATLRAGRPRFGSPFELFREHFDEAYYLAQNSEVRAAVEGGGFRSGFDHYVNFGYFERRSPFPLDRAWYGRQYPIAAIEVGQGDFADFHHHYLAIGRRRGYLPVPPFPRV